MSRVWLRHQDVSKLLGDSTEQLSSRASTGPVLVPSDYLQENGVAGELTVMAFASRCMLPLAALSPSPGLLYRGQDFWTFASIL